MKRFASILIVICLLAAAMPAAAAPARSQIGADVSNFSSMTIDFQPIDGSVFSEYGVSIVTYWATWSVECRVQMGILQQIHEEHPEYGVFGLLFVDYTSTSYAAYEFMEENGYTFPVFVCDRVWSAIVNESVYIPQSFIISTGGIITEVWHAAFTSAQIPSERLAFWFRVYPGSGDVDLNGVVDSADAVLALRHALGIDELEQRSLINADVDESGMVDSVDAIIILRRVLDIV